MTYQSYVLPAEGRRRRVPRWIIGVAVATAVASVVAFVTTLMWPTGQEQVRGEPLAFQTFRFITDIEYDHPRRPI